MPHPIIFPFNASVFQKFSKTTPRNNPDFNFSRTRKSIKIQYKTLSLSIQNQTRKYAQSRIC